MLRIYLDDSGTHRDSDVIVIAGFLGTEDQWSAFEPEWRAVIDKEKISAFHASHCEAADHEFDLWSRARRDALFHDLRQVILAHGLWGVGAAASRQDWDRLVIGKERESLGEPDEFCFRMCMVDALRIAGHHLQDDEIAVVFDDRDESKAGVERVYQIFSKAPSARDKVTSLTFGSMRRLLPLQAADMLAYETYRFAVDWIQSGGTPTPRPHFRSFLENCLLSGCFAHGKYIEEMLKVSRVIDGAIGMLLTGSR